jgi:hypothetical protein
MILHKVSAAASVPESRKRNRCNLSFRDNDQLVSGAPQPLLDRTNQNRVKFFQVRKNRHLCGIYFEG